MLEDDDLYRVAEATAKLNQAARQIGEERRPLRPRSTNWPPDVEREIEAFRAMVDRSPWLNL